ncbi:MAG: hypothetical protein K0R75_809 [Paenibacillaceae bacterium]|nr:hypothetical protein [Paenibacillaceae bacterium]
MSVNDPNIYLAIDNCFASKRWTRPLEWAELIRDMGVFYIEASADNECDPLYFGPDYMADWVDEVRAACRKTGVKVANMYSGHGTYATLGLAHTDRRIRERFQEHWIKPMAAYAVQVGAGIGFFNHAFADSVLQNPPAYAELEQDLYARLSDIAVHCRSLGMEAPGVEQMYTPHQVPWTIAGSERLLTEVYRLGGAPMYLTLDTGHQSGQRKFQRLDEAAIRAAATQASRGDDPHAPPSLWLGPQTAYRLFAEMAKAPAGQWGAYIERIEAEMDRHPHLFADYEDGDSYLWLERLGCYSPIIHLQQTNGSQSAHQPFTPAANANGIIFGAPVLETLAKSYAHPDREGMPPKCKDTYLTLEIFSGTSELNVDIIQKLRDSVRYWRQFIPEDGMKLSEAVRALR